VGISHSRNASRQASGVQKLIYKFSGAHLWQKVKIRRQQAVVGARSMQRAQETQRASGNERRRRGVCRNSEYLGPVEHGVKSS
jgi:hypothetical protein